MSVYSMGRAVLVSTLQYLDGIMKARSVKYEFGDIVYC